MIEAHTLRKTTMEYPKDAMKTERANESEFSLFGENPRDESPESLLRDSKTKMSFRKIGASNHAEGPRGEYDYYATEPNAVDELLKKEKFNRLVWEPACGQCHLVERLEEFGFDVRASDLMVRPCQHEIERLDFMTYFGKWEGDIITNPPFNIAEEFILHSLDCVNDGAKVAMFLRVLFVEGLGRYERLFKPFPPKKIYICSKRMNCAKNGDFETYSKNNFSAYAWFVWQKGYDGLPSIDWINVGECPKAEEPLLFR